LAKITKEGSMDSKRQLQVGELIKRHFSEVLLQQGSYIYNNALVSVTNVKMTPDLAMAKIYLSIYGPEDKRSIINRMNDNLPMLKQELANRIKKHVRRMPVIAVYEDETLDEMYRIGKMMSEIRITQQEEE